MVLRSASRADIEACKEAAVAAVPDLEAIQTRIVDDMLSKVSEIVAIE